MKNFLLAMLMFVGLTLGAGVVSAQCGGCDGGCEAKTAEAKGDKAKTTGVTADTTKEAKTEAKKADCGGCNGGSCGGCNTSVAKRNDTPCGNRKAAATATVVAEANKESGCCSGNCTNCGQGCECKDGKCENCGKKCCEGGSCGGCKGQSKAVEKEVKKAETATAGK